VTFNDWASTQGWRFVDIYSELVGVGNALDLAYADNPGVDLVHWNSAGHLAVQAIIEAYILAEGLVS
jgi:hypothetical protein